MTLTFQFGGRGGTQVPCVIKRQGSRNKGCEDYGLESSISLLLELVVGSKKVFQDRRI